MNWIGSIALAALLCGPAPSLKAQTNPLFNGGDPWITFDHGFYYYSASYCGVATVCIKKSATLDGLAGAAWTGVWNAPSPGPNSGDVWAPEIHKIGGKWYIYYAGDDGDNNHHRLFVLQANTDDPLGSWSMADTGAPNGQLNQSTGHWAIDPDVFTAADGQLYIVWSCTNFPGGAFPQATCLAAMSDPLHTTGATAQISTPTQPWETRTAAIQEGPIGFTHNGRTYITYSASASWTDNDYSAGLLTNVDGRLLSPGSWWKTGPIFDHHGSAYGTGSVVFVPSPDGSETWNLYHAIDSLTCNPSYNCRDIRIQKMNWAADGTPLLGYPLNPGVAPATVPASALAGWGDAFGDAAEGNTSAGKAAGSWSSTDASTIRNTTLGAGWNQIFSESNPNLEDYTVVVNAQLIQTGTTSGFPKYGVYAAYIDSNNYASVWLDAKNKVVASYSLVNGGVRDWANCAFPAGFDPSALHELAVRKSGNVFSIALDGAHLDGPCNDRTFELLNGQPGLATEDTLAGYRGFRIIATGPAFTTTTVANSATGVYHGIAPGEIVSIFGSGLGPVDGVTFQMTGDPPHVPPSLGGVQVWFDGSPAPLFYVSDSQINVQAPYELAGKTRTMVQVTYAGAASNWIPVDVAASDPGVYAVVNQDGSRNGASAPALRATAVVVYGTGQGSVDPAIATGQAAPASPLSLAHGVSASVGGVPATLLFAGMAPGFAGLLQVNLQLPPDAPVGQQPLKLTIGDVTTESTIWLR